MNLAYIDPASGSMVLQILLGGAAAVAVALKMWWRRVLHVLHIRRAEDDETPSAEPVAEARESDAVDAEREPVGKF